MVAPTHQPVKKASPAASGQLVRGEKGDYLLLLLRFIGSIAPLEATLHTEALNLP